MSNFTYDSFSTLKLAKVQYYNKERLRPNYESFEMRPLFIMTSE